MTITSAIPGDPPPTYGSPRNPAPNTPTECPRCGAPAISRQGVAKHDLWHRSADLDTRRQKELLDRLEQFLASAENLKDPETGEPQKFGDWKAEVDEILAELEDIPGKVQRLEERPTTPTVREETEILPWPTSTTEEAEDDPADDADEDALPEPAIADTPDAQTYYADGTTPPVVHGPGPQVIQ